MAIAPHSSSGKPVPVLCMLLNDRASSPSPARGKAATASLSIVEPIDEYFEKNRRFGVVSLSFSSLGFVVSFSFTVFSLAGFFSFSFVLVGIGRDISDVERWPNDELCLSLFVGRLSWSER